MLMLLVNVMMLLCSVILTSLTAVINPTKLESGIIPMELWWELRQSLKMNFIETEEHKLYASIIAMSHLPKEGYSNVKYQIPAT